MDANERRSLLRQTLTEAAEQVIATQGLPALKARDLARAAGCATGAIYNVFPDLDALVLTVNLRTLALFEAAIAGGSDAPARGASAGEAVASLVRLALAYLAFAEEHRLRWLALFQHRTQSGAVPDWYRAEQGRLFRYIEAPLAHLLDPANQLRKSGHFRGAERHYFEIRWDDRRIWGATAAMIVNLSRRLPWA